MKHRKEKSRHPIVTKLHHYLTLAAENNQAQPNNTLKEFYDDFTLPSYHSIIHSLRV
jgi:hypothetical protein